MSARKRLPAEPSVSLLELGPKGPPGRLDARQPALPKLEADALHGAVGAIDRIGDLLGSPFLSPVCLIEENFEYRSMPGVFQVRFHLGESRVQFLLHQLIQANPLSFCLGLHGFVGR